jgi:hypothetical protein
MSKSPATWPPEVSQMHPHNRPRTVDTQTGDFLFRLYTLLFEAKDLGLHTQQRTFETATVSKETWRVVSISQAAINHIRIHKSAAGLQRGHILRRFDRAKHLFDRDVALSRDELLSYFFEHDTVALVTKQENNKDGTAHWSALHPVPEDLFTAGSFSVHVRKGKELKWVESLNGSAKSNED